MAKVRSFKTASEQLFLVPTKYINIYMLLSLCIHICFSITVSHIYILLKLFENTQSDNVYPHETATKTSLCDKKRFFLFQFCFEVLTLNPSIKVKRLASGYIDLNRREK